MKIKRASSLLAIFAIMLLVSCSKGDKKTDTPTTVKKLKYLTQATTVQGGTTTFTNYTYDDKKRVSTAKNGTSTTTYTYNGNDLFSIETSDPTNGFKDVIECTYNNDGALSATHEQITRNNVLSSDITYNYLIVNGRITERHHDIYVDKYTYDNNGNNLTFYSAQSGFTTVDTYDDKLSIYTNGFPNPNGLLFSPNNITSSTSSNAPDINTTYTYTYDTDGYPTGATLNTPAGTTKSSFTYTEF